jgi:hypothetical protein
MERINWTPAKPMAQGRFWRITGNDQPPSLVFVEKQCLGFYVLGEGWLAFQPGQWAGPIGEGQNSANN